MNKQEQSIAQHKQIPWLDRKVMCRDGVIRTNREIMDHIEGNYEDNID